MDDRCMSCEALRKRILAEHERLREAIAKTLGAETHAKLTLAANALLDELAEHLAHEDDLLEPVLRTIDAWGEERARRMRDEHAAQREEIDRLRFALAQPLPFAVEPRLAAAVRRFVERLGGDMAHEERDVLSPELLRDDAISIEFGG
jgi:hypothetical protein